MERLYCMERLLTFSTIIEKEKNIELINYFENTVKKYNYLKRVTLHILRNNPDIKENILNRYLQNRFIITKRTANSCIKNIKGNINSSISLLKLTVNNLKYKISKKELLVKNKWNKINKIYRDRKTNTKKLKLLKFQIYNLNNSINKLKQKIIVFQSRIHNKKPNICLGGKNKLRKDTRLFLLERDAQINYVGSLYETSCNQMFQLSYNKKINNYSIKVRKDFDNWKNSKSKDKYVYGRCYFKYKNKELKSIIDNKLSPISYIMLKKNNRYYLYATITLKNENKNLLTRKHYGTLGLDFNKGFINLSETDNKANLINAKKYFYKFGASNKTKDDLYKVINKITKYSLETGKSIVIEKLNFIKTKNNSGYNKSYNRMLHTLPYSMYSQIIENLTFNKNIELIKVNPYNTSKIAKQKFCNKMKLNIHTGASYVIARRGMGITDKYNIY